MKDPSTRYAPTPRSRDDSNRVGFRTCFRTTLIIWPSLTLPLKCCGLNRRMDSICPEANTNTSNQIPLLPPTRLLPMASRAITQSIRAPPLAFEHFTTVPQIALLLVTLRLEMTATTAARVRTNLGVLEVVVRRGGTVGVAFLVALLGPALGL